LRSFFTAALSRGTALVIVVAGIAAMSLLIGTSRTVKYRAEARLVVPATIGSSSAGGTVEATQLAPIYQSLLVNDGSLRRSVTAATQIGSAEYQQGLSILHPGGAVLVIRFHGASQPQALQVVTTVEHQILDHGSGDGQIGRNAFLELSPPGVLPPVVGAVPTDVATAAISVRAVAGSAAAINADPARYLAETYAALIPLDSQLKSAVRAALRARGIRGSQPTLGATSTVNTSVITVTASAQSARVAIQAARAVASGTAGPSPVSSNISPQTLSILSQPTRASATAGPRSLLPAGIVIGILLGIALLIGWERADPRIGHAEDLRAEAEAPATTMHEIDRVSAEALVARWEQSRGEAPGDMTIALVLGAGREARRGAELADAFQAAAEARGFSSDGESAVSVISTDDGFAERLLTDDPFCVLVVRRGARARRLRRSKERLAEYGRRPNWALLLD
jgi:capsular polysaccharide biosynthesis protein